MELSSALIAAVVIGVAAIDRFLIRRQQLVFKGIGSVTHDKEKGTYNFACVFDNKSISRLRGAQVRYRLFDDKNPTNVINGKDVSLDFLNRGERSVNLFFSDKYVENGEWEFQASLTYGYCRWNPLYKIFPFHTVKSKVQILTKD